MTVQISSEESALLPEEEKLRLLEEAKPGTWYDGWQPFCMKCSTMARMTKQPYGFQCHYCKNMIGWNLFRLTDSPYRDPT